MIDYIKYTVDGITYSLVNNGDGTWSRDETAPSIAGNYLLTFTVSENGVISTIDSDNSLYETYLQMVVETEKIVFLENYVPDFLTETTEFAELFKIEDEAFDDLHANIEATKSDAFIKTAADDAITRLESFIGLKGSGTLSQRKSYLIARNQKGKKLDEAAIKAIANTITGSDCKIQFYGSEDSGNPLPGSGLLRVQVLAPDASKDYKYDDISRTLLPLVPAHIKLMVIKYYALWTDIMANYATWSTISALQDWQAVKDYIPAE